MQELLDVCVSFHMNTLTYSYVEMHTLEGHTNATYTH